MNPKKIFLIVVFSFFGIVLFAAEHEHFTPGIEELVSTWIDLKEILIKESDFSKHSIDEKIELLEKQTTEFKSSTVYLLINTYNPSLEKNIGDLLNQLMILSSQNYKDYNKQELHVLINFIDSSFIQILGDTLGFVKTMNKNYMNMMYIFLGICFLIVIIILVYRSAIFKAKENENYTVEYAHSIIKAHEDERKKLSRELHDTIVQDIISMKLQTEILYFTITKDESKHNSCFDQLILQERECIEKIRDVCYGLHPPELDSLGMKAAVTQLCAHFEERTGIQCSVETSGNFMLTEEEETNLFRIIQEALINTRKHSGATEARIILQTIDNSHLQVSIKDNGVGFKTDRHDVPRANLPRNFGLKGIKERVDILKGALKIESVINVGTEINITMPLTIK